MNTIRKFFQTKSFALQTLSCLALTVATVAANSEKAGRTSAVKEILRDILPNHRLFQCRWFFLLFKPFKLLYNFLFRF